MRFYYRVSASSVGRIVLATDCLCFVWDLVDSVEIWLAVSQCLVVGHTQHTHTQTLACCCCFSWFSLFFLLLFGFSFFHSFFLSFFGCFVQLVTVWVTISFLLLWLVILFILARSACWQCANLISLLWQIVVCTRTIIFAAWRRDGLAVALRALFCPILSPAPPLSLSLAFCMKFFALFFARCICPCRQSNCIYVYLCCWVKAVSALDAALLHGSVSLASSFIVPAWFNIVAPSIIYDARLQPLVPHVPTGLWPSFSSHRLPSNKFMLFYFLLS